MICHKQGVSAIKIAAPVGRPAGGGLRSTHLDHNVGAEYIRGEEHPEHVVYEEAGQQQRRHFERRETYERDEGDAQTHAHRVHEEPMAGEHPDTHDE